MIKRPEEIALLAESGRLLAKVFEYLDGLELIGLSTLQVNDRVDEFIVHTLKARPASKGQYGYAYALNASRNQVVCHGVPSAADVLQDGDIVNFDVTLEKNGYIADSSKTYVLQDGDIVNFDVTLEKNGYIADSSKTYVLGAASQPARRLVQTSYEAMWKGIQAVRQGARLGDVGHAIERHARQHGYSIVRDYCGHGIGREMHEPPQVLHFGKPGTGLVLREGMVFTIEPMLNQGRRAVETQQDGWTVVTRDGQLSAQFEHTVAVTDRGVRVLTLRSGETAPR